MLYYPEDDSIEPGVILSGSIARMTRIFWESLDPDQKAYYRQLGDYADMEE